MEQFDTALAELDQEAKTYDEQFTRLRIDMGAKMEKADAKKIWDHF